MTKQPTLQIQQVSKQIKSTSILNDISFTVYPGEIFGLIGPNGSGKTTLIRLITGLMKAGQGDIFICGHSIIRQKIQALAKVGAIVEQPQFYENLSGIDNLKIFANMYNHISQQRIDEVVKLVRLTERIHDQVGKYSLGMKQRLGIAQAILHEPAILILDEPTNGLDPAGIKELRDYLSVFSKSEGTAVFIATHLLHEVELLCDRYAVIQQGKVLAVEQVKKLKKDHDDHFDVEIITSNPLQAEKILSEPYLPAGVALENVIDQVKISKVGADRIVVYCSYQQIPKLNQKLVMASIPVYEIKILEKTLEEQFIQITTR